MADDASYSAFLDKANEDPSKSTDKSKDHQKSESLFFTSPPSASIASASSGGSSKVPKHLQEIASKTIYQSETDEAFEALRLSIPGSATTSSGDEEGGKGTGIGVEAFAEAISQPKSSVSQLTIKEFDPRGAYKEVVDAVVAAAAGKKGEGEGVIVFKVQGPGARVEYWILAVEGSGRGEGKGKDGGEAVGVRVAAVES